jgi:hypothetical protein
MRIVYRDGWSETFLFARKVVIGYGNIATVLSPTGKASAWFPAEEIAEIYAVH